MKNRAALLASFVRALCFGQASLVPTTLEDFFALSEDEQNAILKPWLADKQKQNDAMLSAMSEEKSDIAERVAELE